MAKTIFILMDAFRNDYINNLNTPFLYQCSQKGKYYNKVKTYLTYCERSKIVSGLHSSESGYFTAIGFEPESSPFKNLWWLGILSFLEKFITKNKFFFYYRTRISRYLKQISKSMPCYYIPLDFLKYFNLTEDKIYILFGSSNSISFKTAKKFKNKSK